MPISIDYHVTNVENNSKKIISVNSKQQLITCIQHRFGITHEIILQEPFENDWLDVEDATSAADGGRLRFIRKTVISMHSSISILNQFSCLIVEYCSCYYRSYIYMYWVHELL